jgi:hypothetical protein
MSTDDQPHWQPISALPLIGDMIRGMLAEGREQYQLLAQARPTPHVLTTTRSAACSRSSATRRKTSGSSKSNWRGGGRSR